MDDEVQRERERARAALRDAQVLLEEGGSDEGAINRLYYAAFHAAQAILYQRGHAPESHGHVRQLFGKHVVLPGDVPRSAGRLLSTLYDHRQRADYGVLDADIDVSTLYHETEQFVDRIGDLLEE